MALDPKPVPVRLENLTTDPAASKAAMLVLAEEDGTRTLTIFIGLLEAGAIASAMEGVVPPRPMTHDLVVHLMEDLEARLQRVEITDLREGTFFGVLVLEHHDRTVLVDCRPSDAIAVAVRVGVPILVHPDVFEKAERPPADAGTGRGEGEIWKEILEEMDEDDFGKYRM
ncbi:MAG: bifunctional nuclease family protein [Deltaproteobacteria bacterium]|nr:bifunctional nuclease family protein [Deltaproteobacteria bacterium]